MVEGFEDDADSEVSLEDVTELGELFGYYIAGLREMNDLMPEDLDLPPDALSLSFHVASAIECDIGIKQRLLAERSTSRRIKALIMLLPVLTSAVDSGLKVHRRAHTNGKGGAIPDTLAQ
jgi:hypothetical protein